MAVKNLYLHIGRGKTGTTALQKFLSSSRQWLREHGVHYVLADDAGRGIGHQDFAKSFIEKPPYYMKMPAQPEQVRNAIAEELSQAAEPNALLSSESFTMANVEKIAAFFRDRLGVVATKIIFFARSQDELAESQYNQMIKMGVCEKSFEDYIETELDELDFPALLAPWAAQFGKQDIIARVYDAARPTVVTDFLACLNLPAPVASFTDAPLSSNESIGYLALEIFRLLNGFDIPRRHRVYPLLQAAVETIDLPPVFFDSAQARDFCERFRGSNELFIREYLGGSGDDLGGRKYSAVERDKICASLQKWKHRDAV